MIIQEENLFSIIKKILLLSDDDLYDSIKFIVHSKIQDLEKFYFTLKLEITNQEAINLLNLIFKSFHNENKFYFNYKDENILKSSFNKIFLIENYNESQKYILVDFEGLFFVHQNILEKKKYLLNNILFHELISVNYYQLIDKLIIDSCIDSLNKIFSKIELIESMILDHYTNHKVNQKINFIINDNIFFEHFFKIIVQNKRQMLEWSELYSLNDDFKEEDINPLKYLPIDLIHFNFDQINKFYEKFGKGLELFNSKIDGIIIKGDNFYGLNFLLNDFKDKIDCIYIDPPYNTGSSDFLYNDNYSREQWLWMIENRLNLAYNLLTEDGIIFISIDDNELVHLRFLLDQLFDRFIGMFVWHKKTQPSFLNKELISVTEYILVYKKGEGTIKMKGGFTDPNKHTELINISNEHSERLLRRNNTKIFTNGQLFTGSILKGIYGNKKLQITLKSDCVVTNGILDSDMPLIGRFRWTQEKIDSMQNQNRPIVIRSLKTLRPTVTGSGKEKIRPPITLLSKKVNQIPTNTDGNLEMKNLFKVPPFYYPKPTDLIKFLVDSVTFNNPNAVILDFFAGSGTTGEAVIKLNREDGGKRKFILIEKEDYFDTILIPRIKKILFSDKWENGKPIILNSKQSIIKIINFE